MTIVSSLPLISIFLLLFDVLLIGFVRLVRPKFAFFWLLAALGALFAWPMVLFTRSLIPQTIQAFRWEPALLLPTSPNLLIDPISWPYAFALATLALAIILTDVARASEADWTAWASTLLLAALGLFAVQAGNPLTLLLAWTTFDLAEVLILLGHISQSKGRERVVVAFTTRLAGSILLIGTLVYGRWLGVEIDFAAMPPQTSLLLLLAAALRLGILPIHQPFLQEDRFRRNLRTMSRLATAASAFMLMTRIATAGRIEPFHLALLVFAGFAGLYSAYAWADARDEINGRAYWLLSLSLLVAAATVRGQPSAALAWGIAALLSGGLLFLYSARHRYLTALLILGLIGISILPYTPSWPGVDLYAAPFEPVLVLFIVIQVILMIGYLRHTFRQGPTLSGVERWVWLIYPWGLMLIVLAQIIIGWYIKLPSLTLANSWPGILVCSLVTLFAFLQRKLEAGPILATVIGRLNAVFSVIFAMNWFYQLLWRIYNTIGGFISLFTDVVEGEGGVLWALLFLVLLIVILSQIGAGI